MNNNVGENARKPRVDRISLVGETEALMLHQLRQLEWIVTDEQKRLPDENEALPTLTPETISIPDTWKLTIEVEPHAWQLQCIAKWRKKKGRGTVKVVTGAGKTLL